MGIKKYDVTLKPFSMGKTLLLICGAALAITILYIFFSVVGLLSNFPNIVVFSFAALIGGFGFQIGYILIYNKKHHGDFRLSKSLGLRAQIGWKQHALWTPSLLFVVMGLFAAAQFIGVWLQPALFSWLPSWYPLETDYSMYSDSTQYITYAIMFVIVGVAVPVVEEVFFRGFLLPRMKWAGKWVVPMNVILFAAYHIWSPWQFVTRSIAMLPLYYVVNKKQSMMLAILVHCLLNILADVLIPLIILLAA